MNLVVGSTGLLGGMIARKLLEAGAPVRVLARSGATELAGAEAVQGDIKERASLQAACAGVTTVITTANSAQRGGEDNVESVDLAGNVSLIDAAQLAGVRQFIFISVAAVDESSAVPLFAAKAQVEKHLRASGMNFTIIAPHIFMDVWFPMIIGSALGAGRPVPLVAGGRSRHSFIAVNDVAAFTVASIGNPSAANRRLVLGGPEAISWIDIVAKTSAIIGRELDVETIASGSPIPSLPSPVDQMIGNLAADLEQQDVILDTAALATEFGVTQTTAETILKRMLATRT
ncbi:MAG TPA: NmrA family NAD(P)-binding protein [Thermoanaerobaculia bacterium]|nr:NmrA family NAD(P)-binding protein [Thermoanaerobaculia bacterium]